MQAETDVRCAIWSEVNVLISGGTAEARAAAARFIHWATHPRGEQFVIVGAANAHAVLQGLLRRTPASGTVFLEEVAGFDEALQKGLLQLVHDGVDTALRVITATGVNLFDRVRSARFRSDLFYRLNTIHLMLETQPIAIHG